MASMLTPSLQVAMNELSNHDHSRFLTRTNHIVGRVAQLGSKAAEEGINLAVMREAVAVQMTWVGAPTVYYGDEAGVCGFTDPDSRRTYPWGQENRELVEFHKEMIRIHKREKPLRTGSLKMLSWSSNVLAYARFQEGEQIIVVLNNSKELKEVTIPVWQAEVPMKGKDGASDVLLGKELYDRKRHLSGGGWRDCCQYGKTFCSDHEASQRNAGG